MGQFKTFAIAITSTFLFASLSYGAESRSVSSPVTAVETIPNKLESNATHDLQVKRLKRMLSQKKLTTEQFFSNIEKIVKRDNQ